MTRVTLRCTTCGSTARRPLGMDGHGVHDTSVEPASCPNGHGTMMRVWPKPKNKKPELSPDGRRRRSADGKQRSWERWALRVEHETREDARRCASRPSSVETSS